MEYRTRIPSKKRKERGRSAATAIVILISIILIALIIAFSPLGSILSDNVVKPVLSCFGKNEEDRKIVSALQSNDDKLNSPEATMQPSAKPTEKNVLTIEAAQFYILQMGVFTEAQEARTHADELALFGAGGNVYHDGSVYRVFAAAYKDEESVLNVQNQVRKDGFEATPYVTDRTGMKITLEGDPDAIRIIADVVPVLSSVPSALCDLTLEFDKQECTDADAITRLKNLLEICEEKIKALKTVRTESIGPLLDLFEKYTESISTFLHEHDTINTEIRSGELKHLQLALIIDYIIFFDRE
jgi:hypothetical protein